MITSKESWVLHFQETFLGYILWGWRKGAWKSSHVTRLMESVVILNELQVYLRLPVPLYHGIPNTSMTQDTKRQMD